MKDKCENNYKGNCMLKAYPNAHWGIPMYPECCMKDEQYRLCKYYEPMTIEKKLELLDEGYEVILHKLNRLEAQEHKHWWKR